MAIRVLPLWLYAVRARNNNCEISRKNASNVHIERCYFETNKIKMSIFFCGRGNDSPIMIS